VEKPRAFNPQNEPTQSELQRGGQSQFGRRICYVNHRLFTEIVAGDDPLLRCFCGRVRVRTFCRIGPSPRLADRVIDAHRSP